MMKRTAQLKRETKETAVFVKMDLDGSGKSDIDTGVGFFDHMLTLFAFHSGIDLQVKAKGDLHVCDHHLIEDTGIVLGKVLKEAPVMAVPASRWMRRCAVSIWTSAEGAISCITAN